MYGIIKRLVSIVSRVVIGLLVNLLMVIGERVQAMLQLWVGKEIFGRLNCHIKLKKEFMESLLKFITNLEGTCCRRLIHSGNCPLCRREVESVVHVVWRCDFALSL